MERNNKQGFVFLPSYYEAINELDNDITKAEVMKAIIDYGYNGVVDLDSLSPVARFGLKLIMPLINAQKAKFEARSAAGRKGGKSKTESNDNQNESKTESNDNQNESKSTETAPENAQNQQANLNQNAIYNKDIDKEKDIDKRNCICEKETATAESDTQTKTKNLIYDWFLAHAKNGSQALKLTDKFIEFNRTEYNKNILDGEKWKNHISAWYTQELKKAPQPPAAATTQRKQKTTSELFAEYQDNPQALAVWDGIRDAVRDKISSTDYRVWIEWLKAIGIEDNKLTILCRTRGDYEIIKSKFGNYIMEAAGDVQIIFKWV